MTEREERDSMQEPAVKLDRETGFSLIELMVAMVITLIITGAIYGLIASGQGAFRREPALVERQQNIRLGLDLITRDLDTAGVGMDTFQRVFTTGLNNPTSALGSVLSELNAGERADFVEMLTNDGSCPTLTTCTDPGVNINTFDAVPPCYALPAMVYVFGPKGPASKPPDGSKGPAGILMMFERGGGGGCGNGHLNAPTGKAPGLNPTGNYACQTGTCTNVSKIQMVRYELGLDPSDGTPALWRSTRGRFNANGDDTGAPPGGAGSDWKLIARGIEDMQVQYQSGNQWPATPNTWLDDPGTPSCDSAGCSNDPVAPLASDYQTVVQRVKITLSGRALGGGTGLGGLTQGAVTSARRGQLTTIISVRSALVNLQSGPHIWK